MVGLEGSFIQQRAIAMGKKEKKPSGINRSSKLVLQEMERLVQIGIALSAEKDIDRLLEMILDGSKEITHADGGTIYIVTDEKTLKFRLVKTDSLGIAMGGTTGKEITFNPIRLYSDTGEPNLQMVVACSVIQNRTINIADAYDSEEFDFSGTRAFDKNTGYRSKSFLSIPMRNHENDIIGVLQLINALDRETGEIIPFSIEHQKLVESLASQAAVAITNRYLIDAQKKLFESFIEVIAAAIDNKSAYTGGHCRRVPVLTLMLADAAATIEEGPLAGFKMTEDERYELKIASWLHDCGKVTTPEYVVDKATKLETIFDRINLVDARFEILARDAKIDLLSKTLSSSDLPPVSPDLETDHAQQLKQYLDDREFLRKCNIGGEFMSEELKERVNEVAKQNWVDLNGQEHPFLTENEVKNLKISRGTLTDEERKVINHHIVATIEMLEQIPYPKKLKNVPKLAGGHHETMDGKGYPKGLKKEQLSVQGRAMAIADIFEALTAKDRPYKKGKTLSEAIRILGFFKKDNHIDPDLFDIFIEKKVYLAYAKQFLGDDQIDEVDHNKIPGYSSAGSAHEPPVKKGG